MKIYPVIMCGGSGTRLWPLSVPERPKQFIPLVAERSSFQSTVQRLAAIKNAVTPLVIAGLAHADWIRLNLAAIGATADILLEPEPRDSAAAVAVAAAWVAARDPDGVIAIVAADHHVPDAEAFARAVETAALAAAEGWIVTLGVRPDAPATAYGYIAAAEPIAGPVLAVSRFVEKPDLERAKAYVDSGFLWNSGNFIARASTLLAAFDAFAPTIGDGARRGVETALGHACRRGAGRGLSRRAEDLLRLCGDGKGRPGGRAAGQLRLVGSRRMGRDLDRQRPRWAGQCGPGRGTVDRGDR